MRLVSTDGKWRIDVIELTCTGHRDQEGQWLRIHHMGVYAGMVRTAAELSRYGVPPLARLEEVTR